MSSEKSLHGVATRVRELIRRTQSAYMQSPARVLAQTADPHGEAEFNRLAVDLFAAQFEQNAAYRALCEAREAEPGTVDDWRQIPAVPARAFKDAEFTCLPSGTRTAVFHSSGTTGQRPSRHFHNAQSLALYEASLWPWFERHCLRDFSRDSRPVLLVLTPSPAEAPHSSLAHMIQAIRQRMDGSGSQFLGTVSGDGTWTLKLAQAVGALETAIEQGRPALLLGTAFSFVHLVDALGGQGGRVQLPRGSRAMETGGYKGRSRSLPKTELHRLISERLGIQPERIVSEYGMSELSSQAYAGADGCFQFPPWARHVLISPESGGQAAEGEAGLIRVFDLANVWSVAALQTEDLGVRRGAGFELIGRAMPAEPRGCALMAR